MAGKEGKNREDLAWEEYLESIEAKPAEEPKRGIFERIKGFFGRLRAGGKKEETEKEKLEKEVAISAEEGKKIAETRKPFEWEPLEAAIKQMPEARPIEKTGPLQGKEAEELEQLEMSSPLTIEKYFEMIDSRRAKETAAQEEAEMLRKPERQPKGPVVIGAEKAMGPTERRPKKSKAVEEVKIQKPVGKAGRIEPPAKVSLPPRETGFEKKVALMPKAVKGKKLAWAETGFGTQAEIDRFIEEKKMLLKKPVKEIRKIPKKEIKKVVKRERIERRARGWYGDDLRHKKAAFSGWRLRKRVKLHSLRKKEEKGKLSSGEREHLSTLKVEDRELRQKIFELNSKIRALEKISKEKDKEGKVIEKKAKAAGVSVPKQAEAKSRPSFRGMDEMQEFVRVMTRVADELARASARSVTLDMGLRQSLSLDDQIMAKEKLIKGLEMAFYKRKINFDQFREKLFDYQSELSEMKLHKEISEKATEKAGEEPWGAPRGAGGPAGVSGAGMGEKAERALESFGEKGTGGGIGEKAMESLGKIAEHEEQRLEERKISERTAVALQKAAENLGSIKVAGGGRQATAAGPGAGIKYGMAPGGRAAQGTQAAETASGLAGGQAQETPREGTAGQAGAAAGPAGDVAAGTTAEYGAGPGRNAPSGRWQQGQPQAAWQGYAAGGVIPQERPGGAGQAWGEMPRGQQAQAGRYYAGTQAGRPRPIQKAGARRTGKAGRGLRGKARQAAMEPEAPGFAQDWPQEPPVRRVERPGPNAGGKAAEMVSGKEGREEPEMGEWAGEKKEAPVEKRGPSGIMGKIREKIVKAPAKKKAEPVSRELDQEIRRKAEGSGVSQQQIKDLEKKLGGLLEKYSIPDNVLESHIRSLDSTSLLHDFQKLISLIEAKRENAAAELIKPAPGFDISTGVIARKREHIVGKEKEIQKSQIETSFDRVLRLVKVKGVISLNDVALQLGLSKNDAQECAEILERNKLIRLIYPPIGPVKLAYPQYLKWKEQEKKKEKEEKKKKK